MGASFIRPCLTQSSPVFQKYSIFEVIKYIKNSYLFVKSRRTALQNVQFQQFCASFIC